MVSGQLSVGSCRLFSVLSSSPFFTTSLYLIHGLVTTGCYIAFIEAARGIINAPTQPGGTLYDRTFQPLVTGPTGRTGRRRNELWQRIGRAGQAHPHPARKRRPKPQLQA